MTDAILDQAQDDKKTLRACTLVAKSWSHQSCRYLYRHIRIQMTTTPGILSTFIETLHTSVKLHASLQRLTITGSYTPLSIDCIDAPSDNRLWLRAEVLYQILSCLPALRHLSIRSAYIESGGMPSHSFPCRFTLSRLEVHHVDSTSRLSTMCPVPLLNILALFSELDVLIVTGIDPLWKVSTDPAGTTREYFPARTMIRYLDLSALLTTSLPIKWSKVVEPSALRTLSGHLASGDGNQDLCALMKGCRALERVTLSVGTFLGEMSMFKIFADNIQTTNEETDGFDYRDLRLGSFPNLHSVAFNQVSVGHPRVRPSFTVLLGLISTLHPETVSSITIGMIYCGISIAMLEVDWKGLQNSLERLRGLEDVILPVPWMRSGCVSQTQEVVAAQWDRLVRTSLPALNAKGILRTGGISSAPRGKV